MKNILNRLTNFTQGVNQKHFLLLVLVLVALSGIGGSYYFYGKYSALKANPNVEAQKEIATLVASVGKLMELPGDETPTVATISDKEKLKDQPFFRAGKNGDKLLVYNAAMTAILYRPSANKIINVAPITMNQSANGARAIPPAASTPQALRIAYANGTATVGLAVLTEKAVHAKYPDYQTGTIANASRKDYRDTLVVDLSGAHSAEAADLARLLNGKTGTLPDGEAAPDADILIISGK